MSYKIIKFVLLALIFSTQAVAEYNLRHQYSENGVIASFFIDDNNLILVEHKNRSYFLSEVHYAGKNKIINHSFELPWQPTHVDFFKGTNVSIVSSSSKNSHQNAANEIYFIKNGKVSSIITDAFGFSMSRNNKYAVVYKGDYNSQEIDISFYDQKGNEIKTKHFDKTHREIAGLYAVADDLSAFSINWGSRDIEGKYKQLVYTGKNFEETLEFDFSGVTDKGENLIYHIEPVNDKTIYTHVSFNNRDRIIKYINNKIVWEYELPFMKWIDQLGFSSDYKYVIVANNPGSFAILNAESGETIVEHILENLHTKRNLSFLPDTKESLEFNIRSNKLYIHEKNGSKLHTYSLTAQKLLKSIELGSKNNSQNYRVVSPNGKKMMSFRPNSGEFYLYDIEN